MHDEKQAERKAAEAEANEKEFIIHKVMHLTLITHLILFILGQMIEKII